jgi:hypothetical protein
VAVVAVVAAVAAFWITIQASFLKYPGWLAVQKADFILGPVFVGLYWRHRRPNNRLGLLLIVLGLMGIPYILESTSSPSLFRLGALTEYAIAPMMYAVILAFPNGRLDGWPERLIIATVLVCITFQRLVWIVVAPDAVTPAFSISACRALCPVHPLATSHLPFLFPQAVDFVRVVAICVDCATAGLLISRFVTGRRRDGERWRSVRQSRCCFWRRTRHTKRCSWPKFTLGSRNLSTARSSG